MSMCPCIPIYSYLKIWPWKSKVMIMVEVIVESHSMGPTFYRLASLSFHVNWPSHSWNVFFFKIWPWKSKVKGHGWGQSWKSQSGCNILLTHIPFVPCQSALPFLRYSILKIWPRKSKVKDMGEVNVESHNMGPRFYWLTSLLFHVNWPFQSWDTAFWKFYPENPRWRSWVRWMLKVTTWVQHSIDSQPCCSMSIGHPIPELRLFQNFTLKIQGQGHGWSQSWKSQGGCNILSTHIPFRVGGVWVSLVTPVNAMWGNAT